MSLRFDCLETSYDLIRELRGVLDVIRRRDRKLHDQLTRALTSVSLNIAEGRSRVGQDKRHLWRVALGSAEEVQAGLRVADAFGYVSVDDGSTAGESLTRVRKMLWRMTH